MFKVSLVVLFLAFIFMISFDMNISSYFYALQKDWEVRFFRFLTDFGLSKIYLIGSALAGLYFLVIRDRLSAFKSLLFFASVALSGILVNIIKVIFARARPDAFFDHGLYGFYFFKTGYEYISFPSGHSATAIGVGVMLSLYFPRFAPLFLGFFALVAFSRVAVLAHFMSDILVGGLIGALVSWYLYARFIEKRVV